MGKNTVKLLVISVDLTLEKAADYWAKAKEEVGKDYIELRTIKL